ncbi:MAG: hypothetical protein EOP06_01800 [Proteobacteria bacterium]|nr:MAG: hypothetical protein EOP06_01800 [Pseudomonadota bacterium]
MKTVRKPARKIAFLFSVQTLIGIAAAEIATNLSGLSHVLIFGIPFIGIFVLYKQVLKIIRELQQSFSEAHRRLEAAEEIGNFGSWERELDSEVVKGSKGLAAILQIPISNKPLHRKDIYALIYPDDAAMVAEKIRETIDGQNAKFDFTARLFSGGELRHFRSVGAVIKSPGTRKPALVTVVRDITELIESREQLRRFELAQAEIRSASALLITCRHEINNPLTIAISSLQALDESSIHVQSANAALWRIANVLKSLETAVGGDQLHYDDYANLKNAKIRI